MATIIARPTNMVAYKNRGNNMAEGFIDGDPSKSTTVIASSSSSACIVDGFDFSALPSSAIITAISVYVKMYASRSGTTKARCVTNTVDIETYTDLGDEEKTVSTSTMSSSVYVSGNFPSAASSMTAARLKNNELQVFIYRSTTSGSTNAYDLYVEVTYSERFSITTGSSPTTGGSVSGGGYYLSGQTVTLSAKANTGYKFKQWSDGNTSVNRTVTVSGNATYTAQFERLKYNITATVSPANSGTVSGAGVYSHGDTATLTATAATGFQFVQWSDGVTSPTRTQTVTDVASFTAIFEKAATSNTFRGTSRRTVYGGIKETSVYKGTTKIS